MSTGSGFFESVLWKFTLFPIVRLVLALVFVAVPIGLIQVLVKSLGDFPHNDLVFTCLAVPAAFVAYWGYVRWIEKRSPTEISLVGAPKEFGRGLLSGAGLFTTVVGLLWIFGFYHVTGSNGWPILIEAFTVSLMSGFLEELLTRGIIFRILEDVLGTWVALAISALLFGMMHLGNPHATWTSAVAIALEAGFLLGSCYVLTRRLWLAIGLHLAWNFTQGGIFGIAVSGTAPNGILRSTLTGPELLSGGQFGAEASVLAVLVCITGFVFVITKARKRGHILSPFWARPSTEHVT